MPLTAMGPLGPVKLTTSSATVKTSGSISRWKVNTTCDTVPVTPPDGSCPTTDGTALIFHRPCTGPGDLAVQAVGVLVHGQSGRVEDVRADHHLVVAPHALRRECHRRLGGVQPDHAAGGDGWGR